MAYTPPVGTQYQHGIAPGQVVIATGETHLPTATIGAKHQIDEAQDMDDAGMFHNDEHGLIENA